MMHDSEDIWIKANVKKTDIQYLQVGKPVRIQANAYPAEPFTGQVMRIGSAATNQFALLPNPNPSGNFTKITQRVEVAVDLEQADPRLKPGMMVELKFSKATQR